jgi:hypothetical protein
MNATQFNQCYPVGKVIFIHQPHSDVTYGREVKTVAIARDFPCGTIVEINVEPYFAKVETLIPANRFG